MVTRVSLKGKALAIAIGAIVSAPLLAADRTVNIYNWSDYIDESILADFEKETGIKVNYDVFDSNEILETKMLTGASGYDIVTPSASFLKRQIKAGIFQPLDNTKLPNLKNAWPVITKITANYDPDNQYSVNYMWGHHGHWLCEIAGRRTHSQCASRLLQAGI